MLMRLAPSAIAERRGEVGRNGAGGEAHLAQANGARGQFGKTDQRARPSAGSLPDAMLQGADEKMV